jgi:transcriptional regulator with XRE-family HTH domain
VDTVGQRLRALRKRAGLTQVELGSKLGVTGATISGYETGYSRLVADELPKYAGVLNCSPCDFFEDATAQPPTPTEPFVPSASQRMARKLLAQALNLPEEDLEALVRVADRLRELPPA